MFMIHLLYLKFSSASSFLQFFLKPGKPCHYFSFLFWTLKDNSTLPGALPEYPKHLECARSEQNYPLYWLPRRIYKWGYRKAKDDHEEHGQPLQNSSTDSLKHPITISLPWLFLSHLSTLLPQTPKWSMDHLGSSMDTLKRTWHVLGNVYFPCSNKLTNYHHPTKI